MAETFIPDPARAQALARAIGERLAASLGELAGAGSGAPTPPAIATIAAASRVSPVVYLRYHDALDAARRHDPDALDRALAAVCEAARTPVVRPQARGFGDASWTAGDWRRLEKALCGPGQEHRLALAGEAPHALEAAQACLAQAQAAIAAADPGLAAEIGTVAGDVVFARPAEGASGDFGGATSFRALGAVVLNTQRHRSVIAMATGLVHEAAHALLMHVSEGAPMVANDPRERYDSPLRADKRPMDGIFHATFVSARIAYALDALLDHGTLTPAQAAEAAALRTASADAFEAGHAVVAAHARPTAAGQAAIAGALAYMRGRTARVLARAGALYKLNDHAGAASLLQPLAAQAHPPPAALRILGLCTLRLGRAQDAVGLLARAHALAPADPWCRLHYGIGLQAVHRNEEAAALFTACQADLPDDPAPWLNLSTSLLALGDVRGALLAARRARARARHENLPHAQYAVGLACLEAGQAGRAADCFRQAVRHAPGLADGWVNLGVAYYRDGKVQAAKQAMRSALAVQPDHEAAAANLGSFLQLTGEVEASEALLRRAIARSPAPAARINLAANLLQEDRMQDALDLLAAGPPQAGPQQPITPQQRQMAQHWRLQQALALIKLGRFAEARTLLDEIGHVPASLAPLLAWRLILLATATGDVEAARRQAARMAHALETAPGVVPEHRIMGHYDLAKHFSQMGNQDAAFAHWTRGHRLLSRFQPFSRADYAAFVDATIAQQSAQRLSTGPRASNRDPVPVFVVGMPRSGTTLAEQVLSAHPAVHGAGERPALALMAERLGGHAESAVAPGRIAALGAPALDAAASAYLTELHALAPGSARIIDKMPGNFRHLGLAGLLLPGAKIIACERDPRDIGLSIFTYRFYGMHAYAHDLADLGWYIGQQRRLMAHWRAVLPNPILTLRLGDWVEDFPGTLRRVLDFLELPYDPACETFHRAGNRVRTVSRAQVKEPINARGLGRWRAFGDQLAPLTAALIEAGALPPNGGQSPNFNCHDEKVTALSP